MKLTKLTSLFWQFSASKYTIKYCTQLTQKSEIEGRKVTSQILTRPGYKAKQIWLPRHNIASDFTLKRLKTVLQGTLIFIKKE